MVVIVVMVAVVMMVMMVVVKKVVMMVTVVVMMAMVVVNMALVWGHALAGQVLLIHMGFARFDMDAAEGGRPCDSRSIPVRTVVNRSGGCGGMVCTMKPLRDA